MQALTARVAAPSLRILLGIATNLIQCNCNHDNHGLLLETTCNCQHDKSNSLNQHNDNHHGCNYHPKHRTQRPHSSQISSTVSRQPYIPGVRRSAMASCHLPPCPVDVPPEMVMITERNTMVTQCLM